MLDCLRPTHSCSYAYVRCTQGDYNVIITGWNEGARQLWYPQSASDTKVVGTEMALVARNLVDFGGAR